MLKITRVPKGDETVTLKLEGRIVGQWVIELARECQSYLEARSKIILDLSGVSFIDDQGIRTLKAMMGDGVKAIGCSSFVSRLLKGESI